VNSHAAGGGLFWDQCDAFLRAFSSNLGGISIFETELLRFILAMEFVARNHWGRFGLREIHLALFLRLRNLIWWCLVFGVIDDIIVSL